MPKDIIEAVKMQVEDIEKNGIDFDDVLEIKKITKKSYATGDEEISFELLLAYGAPNIWLTVEENNAEIFGAWGSKNYSENLKNYDELYNELVEIHQ